MGYTIVAIAGILLMNLEPALAASRSYTDGWVNARGTFFGRDEWNLHEGSCGFGFVCPNRWKNELRHGYDLVAISDKSPLFKGLRGAQCGQCLEIACRNSILKDRYGARIERNSQCKDINASVKVKIVDTCECKYKGNAASNARWCCGDAPHLDVSQWALDKLVKNSDRWGVFAIKYRTVNCNAKIRNEAKVVPIVRDPHSGMRGKTDCSKQKR